MTPRTARKRKGGGTDDAGWSLLLVLHPGSVAVHQSPTGRYFIGPPTLDGRAAGLGFTRLPDVIRTAAELVADQSEGVTVRDVLWRTQPTPSFIHAEVRVQRALSVALTMVNPVRARFASLKSSPGGYDRE